MNQKDNALQGNMEEITRKNLLTNQMMQLIAKRIEANFQALNKRVDAVNETSRSFSSRCAACK